MSLWHPKMCNSTKFTRTFLDLVDFVTSFYRCFLPFLAPGRGYGTLFNPYLTWPNLKLAWKHAWKCFKKNMLHAIIAQVPFVCVCLYVIVCAYLSAYVHSITKNFILKYQIGVKMARTVIRVFFWNLGQGKKDMINNIKIKIISSCLYSN